ncbi:MAG: alanine racemase [Pseudomonadota bacterium]
MHRTPDEATCSRNGTHITLDPYAVARNWQRLDRISGSECGAVVKANGYGFGLETIAGPLAKAGCRTFFVATEAEGISLRGLLPDAIIYILNGIFGDPRPAMDAGLRPFLSCPEALQQWPGFSDNAPAPYALHVDTGMNRLGLAVEEALAVPARPVLLASHFASADTPDHPQNRAQEEAFATVRAHFSAVPASFANSAAVLTRPHTHYELTRPGIALYGGASAPTDVPLEPTAKLETRIIQVRSAKAGETVGYGAAERLTRDSRIAIASAGYADGYLRAAGGSDRAPGAPAAIEGVRTKLLGRVSMDLIAVDVTGINCARGDWIELFGPTVSVDEAAAAAGTIGYELLTGLSRRAARIIGPL